MDIKIYYFLIFIDKFADPFRFTRELRTSKGLRAYTVNLITSISYENTKKEMCTKSTGYQLFFTELHYRKEHLLRALRATQIIMA